VTANTSTCPSAETLAQYLDGSLPPIQRAEVEAHLAACEDCFEQVAAVAVLETECEHGEFQHGHLFPFLVPHEQPYRHPPGAARLGPVAMRMERLLVRDGFSFDEVRKILRGEGVKMTVLELADLRAKLPPRSLRRFVGEERLEAEVSRELRSDEQLEGKEHAQTKQRAFAILRQVFNTLTAEEQVLVRMRTEFKISEIARLRGMEQKPLYKQLEKIYEKLRKGLERHGIRRADIQDLLRGLQPNEEKDDEDGS
jgi:hypothetical protein